MPTRFHTSLNVSDLPRSVEFYRRLFASEPAKSLPDYAKFELEEPPLVLSLIPGKSHPGGSLNHLGFRLQDSRALFEMQARLETAGIKTSREDGVQCCHSTQTKFWVFDPDQTVWEIYILEEDGHDRHHGKPEAPASTIEIPAERPRVIWRHQIPEPLPKRIPHENNSVNEIVLEGTTNMRLPKGQLAALLNEARRVLLPGGEISMHGLVGDLQLPDLKLDLPGPAAVVQYVPIQSAPLAAMINAGFTQVRYATLSHRPCFRVNFVPMREMLLTARKPGHRPRKATHTAVYLGPLAQVTDDHGNIFRRGEALEINIHDWQQLNQSPTASQFLLISPEDKARC